MHCSPTALRRLHLGLTVLWALAVIPTILLWADSVLWVGLMSCWANVCGHWSAYQAARVEVKQEQE